MCNLMKVQSSFRFGGKNYKVHFVKENGKVFPVVEKLVASVLGMKVWKQRYVGRDKVLSNADINRLAKSDTLKVVAFLKGFAQEKMGAKSLLV